MLTGRYHGQPLAPHVLLPLEPVHFARWLMLFERTARTVCPQAGAEYLLEKANRIAGSLQMGVGFSCGEVPTRRWPLMSDEPKTSALLGTLLSVIFRQRIIEPDVDAGIQHVAAVAGQDVTPEAWRAAVTEAVWAGYIHDPVRLQAGALQCHWHLELTALGVEAVRRSAGLVTRGQSQRPGDLGEGIRDEGLQSDRRVSGEI